MHRSYDHRNPRNLLLAICLQVLLLATSALLVGDYLEAQENPNNSSSPPPVIIVGIPESDPPTQLGISVETIIEQAETKPADEEPKHEEEVAEEKDIVKEMKEVKPVEPVIPVDSTKETPPATGDKPVVTLEKWRDDVMLQLKEELESKEQNDTANHHDGAENETAKQPTLSDGYLDSFNYASTECGAKILASSEKSQSMDNVLKDTRENYGNHPCASDKWFVIELCEEIGISSIEIANFEFFSSTFKDFEIYGSYEWPAHTWIHIANFTAQNVRKVQLFHLEEPKWFKYLKVAVTTHYGNQYYCPITVVRVHGTNHVTDLKEKMLKNTKEVTELTQRLDRAEKLPDVIKKNNKPKHEPKHPEDHAPGTEHDVHKQPAQTIEPQTQEPPKPVETKVQPIQESTENVTAPVSFEENSVLVHQQQTENVTTPQPSPLPEDHTYTQVDPQPQPNVEDSTSTTTTTPHPPHPYPHPPHPYPHPSSTQNNNVNRHRQEPTDVNVATTHSENQNGNDNNNHKDEPTLHEGEASATPTTVTIETSATATDDKLEYKLEHKMIDIPIHKGTNANTETDKYQAEGSGVNSSGIHSTKVENGQAVTPGVESALTSEDVHPHQQAEEGAPIKNEEQLPSPKPSEPVERKEPAPNSPPYPSIEVVKTSDTATQQNGEGVLKTVASINEAPSPSPEPIQLHTTPSPTPTPQTTTIEFKKKRPTEILLEKVKHLLRRANGEEPQPTMTKEQEHQANELENRVRAEKELREEEFIKQKEENGADHPHHARYTQESVFTTLANRIKLLEINQSLANRYLDKISEKVLETYEELEFMKADRISLLQAVENVAEELDALELQVEIAMKAVETQMEQANTKMKAAFEHELAVLRQEVKVSLIEERNEHRMSLFVWVLVLFIVYHYTQKVISGPVHTALADAYAAIKTLFTPIPKPSSSSSSTSSSSSSSSSSSPSSSSSLSSSTPSYTIPSPPPPPSFKSYSSPFSSPRYQATPNYLEVDINGNESDDEDDTGGEKEVGPSWHHNSHTNTYYNGHTGGNHHNHNHNGSHDNHHTGGGKGGKGSQSQKRKLSAQNSAERLKELMGNSKDKNTGDKRKKRKKS